MARPGDRCGLGGVEETKMNNAERIASIRTRASLVQLLRFVASPFVQWSEWDGSGRPPKGSDYIHLESIDLIIESSAGPYHATPHGLCVLAALGYGPDGEPAKKYLGAVCI